MGGLIPTHPGGGFGHSGAYKIGNPLVQPLEPPMMSQIPGYLTKFVAGPVRLEANPLGEPMRTIRTLSPTSQQSRPQ